VKTYLVVPAWSDQAGQCRIVSRQGRHPEASARIEADRVDRILGQR
jgi:hypothetical protein